MHSSQVESLVQKNSLKPYCKSLLLTIFSSILSLKPSQNKVYQVIIGETKDISWVL
jgi:hypothetical protein